MCIRDSTRGEGADCILVAGAAIRTGALIRIWPDRLGLEGPRLVKLMIRSFQVPRAEQCPTYSVMLPGRARLKCSVRFSIRDSEVFRVGSAFDVQHAARSVEFLCLIKHGQSVLMGHVGVILCGQTNA